jgi:protein-S-isoprenylcysteine O-methyltransferase Ste14
MNTIDILIAVQFAYAAVVFVFLMFVSAPYGRHFRRGWGLTFPTWTAWLVMESPSFLVILAFFLLNIRHASAPAVFLFLLWEAHYLYRTFVYPFIIRGEARKKFPILLVVMAIAFNALNATVNGSWLFVQWPYGAGWFHDPRFVLGILLFAAGFAIHTWSDRRLRLLRKPGETGYKVPKGGLFELISCPNYFGEILQWFGFALATWSWAGLSFAVFTLANIGPRAVSNHRWYLRTFPGYPKKRKAIIPFVY